MAKEKATLYHEMQFDNYAYAVDTKQKAEADLQKLKSSKLLAIIGTICSIVGYFAYGIPAIFAISGVLIMAAIVLAIISYIRVGGIGVAARWALNIGKAAWFFFPFPMDLVAVIFGFMFGFFALFFLPYFAVRHQEKQLLKDIEAADEYIKYCRPTEA